MPTVCHSSTLNSALLDSNLLEQGENVYENKGLGQESTTPDPYLSEEEREFLGSPPRTRRGWGWCDFGPWRETRLLTAKVREQSENVYENKGTAEKSTTPAPPYPRRGIADSPPRVRRGWGWCDFVTSFVLGISPNSEEIDVTTFSR